MTETVKMISWNVGGIDRWDDVMDQDVDLVLLQEARPAARALPIEVIPDAAGEWRTSGWEKRDWRTCIARLSDRVSLHPRLIGNVDDARDTLMISRPGTIAAVDVYFGASYCFTAVSMYAPWERPPGADSPIYADASAHRILSDLSALVVSSKRHRLIAAGDLNILHGYGERGNQYWRGRYNTVFDRASAMGIGFVGPQHPNGRQADPWPDELPRDSKDVVTFHTNQQAPETAARQMDFVFASDVLHDSVRATALNEPDEWGPSDHCRILIEVAVDPHSPSVS